MKQKAFFRILRLFIVNLEKIDWIKGNSVQVNRYELPVSKSHKQEFLNETNQKNFLTAVNPTPLGAAMPNGEVVWEAMQMRKKTHKGKIKNPGLYTTHHGGVPLLKAPADLLLSVAIVVDDNAYLTSTKGGD